MGAMLPQAIGADGPVLEVWVGFGDAYARNERRRGRTVPPNVQARLLVDTGASATVLTPGLVAQLGLVPRAGAVATPVVAGGVTVYATEYEISLVVPDTGAGNGGDLYVPDLLVLEMDLGQAHFDGLLGRSVLQHCTLTYDGPLGHWQLAW